ncbi:exopolyphosphatase [Shewanella maritima]|uniref:Ppx/GppA phosphatase family protein n=1 Tax=Shewanella maritima TaxID=2520507 RepID=UPI003735358D
MTQAASPFYAAITLGSNSFNMLVAQTVAGHPSIVAKYKQKVRLAEGITDAGALSTEVMRRGLDCLTLFAQKIAEHQILLDNVAVYATATLRQINNADEFHKLALPILGKPIEVISGLKEAELIYQGMAATTEGDAKRLVIDIGGASTEFIVGDAEQLLFKTSLPMGCVLFNREVFAKGPYTLAHFSQAKTLVSAAISDDYDDIAHAGWQQVLGASGVVQSVISVLKYRQQAERITLDVLLQLRDEIIALPSTDLTLLSGLDAEKAPTFASGIAILLALFELLKIDHLILAGGALREGVLYQLAANIHSTTDDEPA